MLAKKNRLTRNKDFDRVFKQGKSAYGQFLGFKIGKNEDAKARVAVIVSKKVSKRAVKRNRLKRQLLEIIRIDWLNKLAGLDLMIICLPAAKDANVEQLGAEVKSIFTRLNLK